MRTVEVFADVLFPFIHVELRTLVDRRSQYGLTDDGGSWFCTGLAISGDDFGNFVIAWKQGTEAFVERVFG